jgi:chaperone BCS1
LETFNKGEERYKRSGFTFKAGLLFYGSPGCGKTSTIKAILKYTNRHGIIINLSKIKTCDELQNIFRKRKFKDTELNGKQICYILEDCDAFDNNIIQSRNLENNEKINELSELGQLSKLIDLTTSSNMKLINKVDDDTVNLSCFLNILDGIIELHGIMIIMTTNYPEKIDEALIRPGRFDFKYEFKRASKNIIKEMLQFKYELSEQDINNYIKHLNILDEKLSPAEVQSICFKNDNVVDCIKEIVLASQKNNN